MAEEESRSWKSILIGPRGNEVVVVDREVIPDEGEGARIRYRRLYCEKTGDDGIEFQMGEPPGENVIAVLCEDCSLFTHPSPPCITEEEEDRP